MIGTKENVAIQAGHCTVNLIPALGGKISSITVGNHQLLQDPINPYDSRTYTMPFADADASGWDECIPSVADCRVDTVAGLAHIPDHGDLWRVPWNVIEATPDSATLRATCFSLPLQLTRSIYLSATKSGWRLELLYSLTNLGDYEVPWAWTAHPLFAVSPGDRILLPDSVRTLRLEGSRNNRLGQSGDAVWWPIARTTASSEEDLSIAHDVDSGIGDKLFAGPMADPLKDDWCALERKSIGLRLTVRFDPALTPYLGLWICYGGWPEGAARKQVCVALEPSTTPVDSLAVSGDWSRKLKPAETFNWPMELLIDRIDSIDSIDSIDPNDPLTPGAA